MPEDCQGIKTSLIQTKQKIKFKSTVVLLPVVHSILTFSDKRKHPEVLFWIIRAQALNLFNGQSCNSGTWSSFKNRLRGRGKTNKQSAASGALLQKLQLPKLLKACLFLKPFSFNFSYSWCCWIHHLLIRNANAPKLQLHSERSWSSEAIFFD